MAASGSTRLPRLPSRGTTLLIRTDFSNERAWETLVVGIRTPTREGFLAVVDVVNDPAYEGLSPAQLSELLPEPFPGPFFHLVADHDAMASAEHPILVVPVAYPPDLAAVLGERPRTRFRVVVAELWSVENNLSIANLDWDDFIGGVSADGVFRGF